MGNSNTHQNVHQIKQDVNVLQQADIFKKMVQNCLGKYIKTLNKLRGHGLQCMMEEKLGKETLNKLMERLIQVAEGTVKGWRSVAYSKLKKNSLMMEKKKAVCKMVMDKNFRLMNQGYVTLHNHYEAAIKKTQDKVKFIIATLMNKDLAFVYAAYQGMKERYNMLNGVGCSNAEKDKIALIKRLTNSGHNMQVMAVNSLREFLKEARHLEENAKAEFERQQKEKERILKRIMDINARFMGMGFRQALQHTVEDREAEIRLMQKQRGIMKRMVDSNVRLMSAGYNKLIEEWKAKNGAMKEKLKFVIAALTDKDKQFIMMAYNGMKQRALMLAGVGLGDAEMKKCQLIKRLTNQGHNFQVMGVNCVREFLKDAGIEEENDRLEAERQMKEKERILRRIINTNCRFMGMGFRQALQFTIAAREAEIALMAKQRGIMRRMCDSGARLQRAGYNKLIEEWKARQAEMKEKLRFVIAALTDKDKMFTLMAYNGLTQRAAMLNGVGMNNTEMLKIQLIKRLTNSGYNLQVMGVNCIREFLKDARVEEENDRLEAERQSKEKDRILRRIMNSNLRFAGMAFRQALQWTVAAREAEIALAQRMRGICNRIVDSGCRLMSAGYNKLVEEWKAKQAAMKEKLRFVIAALTDKDKMFTMMAYNQLKQRKLMLEGVGFGDDVAQKLKIRLIRKLTDVAYNMQVMGVNCIKEWLASERNNDELARLEAERQAKEKERILRRIMDSNLRWAGIAFRQALQWTV